MPRTRLPRPPVSFETRQKHLTAAVGELYQQVRCEYASRADESLVQALTCTFPVAVKRREALKDCWDWLRASADEWTQSALSLLEQAVSRPRDSLCGLIEQVIALAADDAELWNLCELLLSTQASQVRRGSGTFYTPPPIAQYLVAMADRNLREKLGLAQGLADPTLKILEPACGSGEFIAAVLELLCRRGRESLASDRSANSRVVTRQRLPTPDSLRNIIAIDVSPVAIFISRFRVAVQLQRDGFELANDLPQPQFLTGNALAGPDAIPALRQPIGVVLGNPPFSYLSQNEQPWIQALIRGDEQHAGYFAIDGEALGEKKTWLHDDYVKFLRLAQWCIEQNGRGVVSLVTNHGWLDNATFRIARQQLLRTFDQIDVVDLHGNAKRHEVNPTGGRDQNVFGIAQGIALVTLTKGERRGVSPPCSPVPPCPLIGAPKVSRADLWGSRATKLQRLEQAITGEPLQSETIAPAAPWFAFAAPKAAIPTEYAAAPLLTDVMPVNSTTPVTARDHFVIARTPEELLQRIDRFCDLRISDEEIRSQFFSRTRSQRYPAGDTRGWKLAAARRIIREEANPQQFVRRCLYRPFVWRYVFWHPALIDWPRTDITRHLLGDIPNLALLARRQSIAGREANFFWITDCLPLDGVIRSDNRGSESFFPLWLLPADRGASQANLRDQPGYADDPVKCLQFLYALFFSPVYRQRYASGLAMEFPRVLWPREAELFEQLAEFGRALVEFHLTDPRQGISNHELPLADSDADAFHVGTYNVCRKWLQMEQQTRDSAAFESLQQLIGATVLLQTKIDVRIELAGGFSAAFRN